MKRWSICRYGNSINYYPEKNQSHVSNVGLFLILTRKTSTSVLCAMQIWPCSFIQAYKTCPSKGNGVNRLQSQCNSKKKQQVPFGLTMTKADHHEHRYIEKASTWFQTRAFFLQRRKCHLSYCQISIGASLWLLCKKRQWFVFKSEQRQLLRLMAKTETRSSRLKSTAGAYPWWSGALKRPGGSIPRTPKRWKLRTKPKRIDV